MIYKARFRDYLITGVATGILYGLIMYLFRSSAVGAIVGGLTFGILYPAIMAFAGQGTVNRGNTLRQIVAQGHRITCDGVAKRKEKPGWMFLCEDALVYYPNHEPQPMVMPLAQILNVTARNNRLIVHTQAGEYKFIVAQCKQWQQHILRSIGK